MPYALSVLVLRPSRVDESILIGRDGDGLGGDRGRQKAAKVIVGLIVLQVSYTEVN